MTDSLPPPGTFLARELFGIDCDWEIQGFSGPSANVPELDPHYHFDHQTTLAILAGFARNLRVLVQGCHGTGKTTHIEQVAARLNWPCVRVNLDSHISRIDLVGKDAIILQEGRPVTTFQEGILPWHLQRPTALVFDEYDAGRPDVMFVIQRVLESGGKLNLLEQQGRIISPHPGFRLFATANTLGLGDVSGLYHGTQQINQGQMDRWNITARLDYLDPAVEARIILSRFPGLDRGAGRDLVRRMVATANLVRESFRAQEISTVMSPRTVLHWAENTEIFGDPGLAFRLAFLNRCDDSESVQIMEFYQRGMGEDLGDPAALLAGRRHAP